MPSTNNDLESWNLIIKLESAMRQCHNIGAFLTIVENEIIGLWSRDRHPDNINRAIFYTSFVISTISFFCHVTKKNKFVTSKKNIHLILIYFNYYSMKLFKFNLLFQFIIGFNFLFFFYFINMQIFFIALKK